MIRDRIRRPSVLVAVAFTAWAILAVIGIATKPPHCTPDSESPWFPWVFWILGTVSVVAAFAALVELGARKRWPAVVTMVVAIPFAAAWTLVEFVALVFISVPKGCFD